MNVGYLISTLERTGPTNVLYDLVAGLDRTCFNPVVFTLSPEPARSRLADFQDLGIAVHTLNMGRMQGLLHGAAKVRAALAAARVDVLHTHGLRADLVASSLSGKQATCSTVHAVLAKDYRLGYGKCKGAMVSFIHGCALKKIDQPVGCSSAVFRFLKNTLELPNAVCIKNGVSTERFRPDSSTRASIRSRLGIGSDECVWIATGALISRKNPEWLIDAWASAYGNVGKMRLLILGNGPLMEACAGKAKQYENITLTGNVDKVSEFLSASDIFVSCSEAEGLPLAVLEAVACGLRCLISDIEPHLEIADNAPLGISTFELGDSQSFKNAADKVQALTASSSVALRDYVCTEFSATAMAKKYEGIYQRLQK